MKKSSFNNNELLQQDLLAAGWTKSIIDKLYGPLDKIEKRYGGGTLNKFNKEKVEKIQQTDEWKELSAKAKIRSQKSKEVARKLEERMLMVISKLEIKVPIMPLHKLFIEAAENYNDLWMSRGDFEKTVNVPKTKEQFELVKDDPFFHRISVNYLRHELTCYEYRLNQQYGKVGATVGYFALKDRVIEKIKEAYPELKVERY